MKNAGKNKNKIDTKEKLEEKRQFLTGLKRYEEKGVSIKIDGKTAGPKDWEKLLEVREDGIFYMGDYISNDAGELKEIRFDKVYNK